MASSTGSSVRGFRETKKQGAASALDGRRFTVVLSLVAVMKRPWRDYSRCQITPRPKVSVVFFAAMWRGES